VTILIFGLIIFLGVHSVRIVAEDWRSAQIKRLGGGTWKGLYSLISLVGFGLILWGYGAARADPSVLWVPAPWTRHVAALLTFVAFILIAAAYVPGTRIKAAVGHPMVLGVKIWAFAHLLANGTVADLWLFGGVLVWAIVDYVAARRRDRVAGTVYAKGPISRDGLALVFGVIGWAVFAMFLHQLLIGVRPFG
jgi:uncharacterized membrane protein